MRNYDKKKINFRQSDMQGEQNSEGKKKRGAKKGRQSYQRLTPQTNKVIRVPRRRKCPKHKGEFLQATEEMAERTIIDLVFTKSGVRKQITKYLGTKSYCQKCHYHYNPHITSTNWVIKYLDIAFKLGLYIRDFFCACHTALLLKY